MWKKLQSGFWAQKLCAYALILATCVVLFARYPGSGSGPSHVTVPGDFSVYLRAWERVSSNQSPYVSTDPSPYKYAPGILPLVQLLPREPASAWFAFSVFSILLLGIALASGSTYRNWREVWMLLAGIILGWKGILETFDYGQVELIIFSIAVIAGSLIFRFPTITGLLVGFLPWLKLPWALLFLPFVLVLTAAHRMPGRKRVRRFTAGYFFACFLWAAAIPSITFGAERSIALMQEWIRLLRSQPLDLYFSDINQSLFVSAYRWSHALPDPMSAALAITLIFGGILLGLLSSRAVSRSEAQESFSWLGPWLVLTQLLNPLAWRWGSVYALGIPLSSSKESAGRIPLWTVVGFFWLGQLTPVLKWIGIDHWTRLHPWGWITLYWFSLLLVSLRAPIETVSQFRLPIPPSSKTPAPSSGQAPQA